MNAFSIRDLLQRVIDQREADSLPAGYRTLQEMVEAEEMREPRGLTLNRTTASQIVKGTYKGEPSIGTIRAIGWLAGVDDETAFAAAGRRPPGPPFADDLPPGVDDLTDNERRAVIEILRALVAQRREINSYVMEATKEPRTPRQTRKDQKNELLNDAELGPDAADTEAFLRGQGRGAHNPLEGKG